MMYLSLKGERRKEGGIRDAGRNDEPLAQLGELAQKEKFFRESFFFSLDRKSSLLSARGTIGAWVVEI